MQQSANSQLRKDIENAFKNNAFALPVFYNHNPALRFELSQSGNTIQQFNSAYDRGRQILDTAFADVDSVILVVSVFASEKDSPFGYRDTVRSLHRCGLSPTRTRALWCSTHHDIHEDMWRVFLAFEVTKEQLESILWGAIARDLGIQPALLCHVYIVSLELPLLAHPYDDRGMDIIGNPQRLYQLYQDFDAYVLEYDRQRMADMMRRIQQENP